MINYLKTATDPKETLADHSRDSMIRRLFLAVFLFAGPTACEVGGSPDRDAVEHFLANAKAFEELNQTISELHRDNLSLEPGSEVGTVRLTSKPVDRELSIEESAEYSVLLESFVELDLALISRSDGYAVFHRNAVGDGEVQHFFEYVSQSVKNESMRCKSHEQNAQAIRSCLVDLDGEWSMWIKTLPAVALRDRDL